MKRKSTEIEHHAYNLQPFRRAVLRGFGVILPPLLTIVILLWIGNTIQKFVLSPVEWASRQCIVWCINRTDSNEIEAAATVKDDAREDAVPQETEESEDTNEIEAAATQEDGAPEDVVSQDTTEQSELARLAASIERIERQLLPTGSLTRQQPANELNRQDRRFSYQDEVYVKLPNGEWIPAHIVDQVREYAASTGILLSNGTAKGYYNYYVEHRVLRKGVVIPVFFAGFILLMYLLGKFLAAGVGRILWKSLEAVIAQLPIIRTVYNSVKQVTDFFVGESDIDFQRVVAVEYPRKGTWSVGFVTGESLLSIRGAVDEPIVSVLMPTSPVPGTGFTITVRKSETIDLDIPIEQALQFVVSCGVVVPASEVQGKQPIQEQLQSTVAAKLLESGSNT